jgi:hypothetical protein
MIKLQR